MLAKSISCAPGMGQEFDYSSPAFYLDLTRARGTTIRIERSSFDVPGSTQRSLIVKIESVIYEPPSPEFPHLVVTLTPNGVDVQTASDRTEARTIMRSHKAST